MRSGDEASDNAMERITDEVEVVNAADIQTVGIWRSTLPPFRQDTMPTPVPAVAPAEAVEHAPSIARDTLVMMLVFALLLAVALTGIAYAMGYASGHRNALTPRMRLLPPQGARGTLCGSIAGMARSASHHHH